jgi:predicted Zn-dependent protease with MMP-like domain
MNLSQVIEEIKKRQAENVITLQTFEKVCNLLGKFEGKEITKRIETF